MQEKKMIGTLQARLEWVDIAKGILIISVLAGHFGFPQTGYIYLFHIPAFFVLTGYTSSPQKVSLVSYIWKKCKTILFPFYIVNILFFTINLALNKLGLYDNLIVGDYPGFKTEISVFLRNPMAMSSWGGATWFLFVLFTAEIIYALICTLCKNVGILKDKEVYILFIVGLAGAFCISFNIVLPFMIDVSLMACIYIAIGKALSQFNVFEKHIEHKVMIPISFVVVIFFGSFFYHTNIAFNWPTKSFPVFPVALAIVFCCIYILYLTSCLLEKLELFKNVLSYIGKRAFSIFVFHFLAMRVVTLVLILLKLEPMEALQRVVPIGSYLWIFYTFGALLICLIISFISEKSCI
ncbi:MAG: acyltransferase family protein, partial [Ruthenibacterium sp.]